MGVPLTRRIAAAVPLLFVISAVVFGLLHLVPGGPLAVYLSNPDVRPEDLERLKRALGLDQPVWRQYAQWLGGFLSGDWGFSYSDGRPVVERVVERLPATLELVAASLVLASLFTAPWAWSPGSREAGRPASRRFCPSPGWRCRCSGSASSCNLSSPSALAGCPRPGRNTPGLEGLAERLAHLVLPATMLAAVHAAAWSRYLRAAVIDTYALPFVAAARARGAVSGS